MPRRNDLHRILIIGSGPIVIGQACEFDYSGTQATKALRADGYEVILVNSNPATIMTDPDLADKTYVEPLTLPYLEKLGRARTAGAPRVIAISQDDSCATAQFNFRFGISNLTTLLDPPPYRVSNAYGIENVPSLFLVEQDGRISRSVAGFEKAEMIRLGERCGVELFTARDRVPVFQPG